MEKVDEVQITIEIVHQRIGRNLLLFQKLEHTLKSIVAMSEISGYSSDIARNEVHRKARVMKQTLGQIVGEHVGSFNPAEERGPESAPTRNEPFLSIRVSTLCEGDFLDHRKSVLAGLVKDRNELVHHLLTTYNLKDQDGRRELVEMLDDQHQRLQKEVELSFELRKSHYETRRELAALLQSEEGRRIMFEGIRNTGQIDGPT